MVSFSGVEKVAARAPCELGAYVKKRPSSACTSFIPNMRMSSVSCMSKNATVRPAPSGAGRMARIFNVVDPVMRRGLPASAGLVWWARVALGLGCPPLAFLFGKPNAKSRPSGGYGPAEFERRDVVGVDEAVGLPCRDA